MISDKKNIHQREGCISKNIVAANIYSSSANPFAILQQGQEGEEEGEIKDQADSEGKGVAREAIGTYSKDIPLKINNVDLTMEESPLEVQEEMQTKSMQENRYIVQKKTITLGVMTRHKSTQSERSTDGGSIEFHISNKSI